jgi:type I restriction enzyme S subunit
MTADWQDKTWGDIATLEYGKGLRDYSGTSGQFPVFGTNGQIGWHAKALYEGPSVIVGRKGAYRGIHYSRTPFFVIDTAFFLKQKITFDMKWAYYELLTHDINSLDSGSAIPSTSRDEFYSLDVRVPPLPEQRRIAHILGTLDDKIENNRKTAKTLEAMAQAIFKSWFVDFDPVRAKMAGESRESICKRLKLTPEILDLFPDRLVDSELGEIPEGWEVKPFLDVCDLKGGAQPPASTFINKPMDGYIRLIQIRDFSSDSHPTYVKESPRLKRVTEDDILIGRYGSASGNKDSDSLGRVCRGLAGAYNVALMKLSPILVGSEFAYQLVSSKFFYDYLQGASSKAVQAGFSKSELRGLLSDVPPEALSGSYEKLGKIIWTEKKSIYKVISRLSAIRDTLLPKLISGEIRVSETEPLIEEATE